MWSEVGTTGYALSVDGIHRSTKEMKSRLWAGGRSLGISLNCSLGMGISEKTPTAEGKTHLKSVFIKGCRFHTAFLMLLQNPHSNMEMEPRLQWHDIGVKLLGEYMHFLKSSSLSLFKSRNKNVFSLFLSEVSIRLDSSESYRANPRKLYCNANAANALRSKLSLMISRKLPKLSEPLKKQKCTRHWSRRSRDLTQCYWR